MCIFITYKTRIKFKKRKDNTKNIEYQFIGSDDVFYAYVFVFKLKQENKIYYRIITERNNFFEILIITIFFSSFIMILII